MSRRLEVSRRSLVLGDVQEEADGREWVADELRDRTRKLLESAAARGPMCVVAHASLGQVRRLEDLPPVREEKLPSLVALQMRRLFRRADRTLTCGARWLTREEGTGIAVAVPEQILEAVAAGADEAGVEVTSIVMEVDGLLVPLAPPSLATRQRRRERTRTAAGAGLAAAAWVFAAGVYVQDLDADRRALTTQAEQLAAPLAEMDRAGTPLSRVAAIEEGLSPLMSARWRPLEVWVQLAHALPADAELERLTLVREGEHRADGLAADPLGVLQALDRHPAFTVTEADRASAEVDAASGRFSFSFREVRG